MSWSDDDQGPYDCLMDRKVACKDEKPKKEVLVRHVQRKTALVKGNLYFMAYCSKLSLKGESINTIFTCS